MYKHELDRHVITGMALDFALGFNDAFDGPAKCHITEHPGDLRVAVDVVKQELLPTDSEVMMYRFRILNATLRKVIAQDEQSGFSVGVSDPARQLGTTPRLALPEKKAA